MKRYLNLILFMSLFMTMSAKITIGKAVIYNPNSFEVQESVTEQSTAKLVIPKELVANDVMILDVLKVGDPITIEAGYDYNYAAEFKGYIKRINAETPITIECEDELYLLRQTNYIKTFNQVTLKELLTFLQLPYKIDCPDVKMVKFYIDNSSAFQVLEAVKEQYGLYSRIVDKTLYVGFAYDFIGKYTKNHKYTLGVDSKKNNLEFKSKDDFKLKIKATSTNQAGKKLTVEVGSKDDDASVKTINYPNLSKAELEVIANAQLKKLSYSGYSGNVDGYGVPRTRAGDSLTIVDPDKIADSGTYLIEKVTITYNDSGAYTRSNQISYKI